MNSCGLIHPPEFRAKDALIKFNSIAQAVSDFDVYVESRSSKYADRVKKGDIKSGVPFLTFDRKGTAAQPSHMQDFINSVRSRRPPSCNEDEAFIEAANLIMAMKAYRENRKVRWDPAREEIV